MLNFIKDDISCNQEVFFNSKLSLSKILERSDYKMERESQDNIFSDFKKAFYTVSHYSLLGEKMGVSKIILNIVSYFLLHRSIKVKIGNNYSERQNIPLVFLRVQYWDHHY